MDRALLQDRRVWIAGGVIAALIIAAASWFMLISPKVDSTDSLNQQKGDAQTANSVLASKNDKLKRESRNLDALKAKLQQAVAGLPADSGLADFTREVTSAAAVRRVTLTTIEITPPTAPAAAAPADTSGTGATTSTPSAAPSTSSTPAAGDTSGAVSIDATLTTSGSLAQQTGFLSDLQNGARRMLVTSSQVSVSSGSRVSSVDAATTMTTQLTIFTSPGTEGELAALKATVAGK
jgi:hypothetical protein